MPQDLDDALASQPKKVHWFAAIFWVVVTAVCFLGGSQGASMGWLLGALTAAYSIYLLRGGRFAFYIW